MSEIEFSFVTPAGTRRTQVVTIAGGDVPPATGPRQPAMMDATPADPAVTIDLTSGIIKIDGHPIPGSAAQGPANAVQFAAASGSDFVFGGDSRFTFDPATGVLTTGLLAVFPTTTGAPDGSSALQIYPTQIATGDIVDYLSVDNEPTLTGPHTVAGFQGIYNQMFLDGGVAVTSLEGIRLARPSIAGGATVGSSAALIIGNQSGIGSVANYAIHILDQGSAANAFAIYVGGGKVNLLGPLILPNIPTSDPGVPGQLYSVAGVVHVS